MLAVLSHSVLLGNYVPFFDLTDESVEDLDSFYKDRGELFVLGRNKRQLFWVATAPKRMVVFEDDSTYTQRVEPMLFLCGFEGLPLKGGSCIMFTELEEFDKYARMLDMTYLYSSALESIKGSRFYCLKSPVVTEVEDPDRNLSLWPEFQLSNVGSEERL